MANQTPTTIRIAHLADIHIQDLRRSEYAAVFASLYASLRQEKPDLIVVAGDVLDKNTRASAHNIEDTTLFLMNLADIAPVVMITGNHDTNCLTPGALDLLTPIVKFNEKLAPPRLTYWRSSGVYAAHGLLWTVIAPDGPKPSQPEIAAAARAFGLEASPWVCLFHEEVDGARFPNGQMMRDTRLKPKDLEMFDIALGGHIHLRQNISPRAAYCGSLVQQNIGERHVGHGYLLWTICRGGLAAEKAYRTKIPDARGIDIQNLQGGFARIEISEGEDVTEQPPPKEPILWELSHDASMDRSQLAGVIAAYTSRYNKAPRAHRLKAKKAAKVTLAGQRPAEKVAEPEDALLARAQEDARDPEVHEEVIRELLGSEHPRLADVIKMHKHRYGLLTANRPGCARIRLLSLTFSDLYCFGPDNVIDFTKLEGGVSGVIAPNYSGKSSLIDVILFALYEEHPRARIKSSIIRAGAPSYRLTLRFELDGNEGVIEKGNFSRGKTPHSLYRFTYAGRDYTQNTTATLEAIRSIVGEASHALSCAVMLQNQDPSQDLVTASIADRKKLLSEILALGDFSQIEHDTSKEYAALNSKVKTLQGQYGGQSLEAIEEELDLQRGNMEDAKLEVASIEQALRSELSRQGELRKTLSVTEGRLRECSTRLTYGPQPSDQAISPAAASDTLQRLLRASGIGNEEAVVDELRQWNSFVACPGSTQTPTYFEAASAATKLKDTRASAQQDIPELTKKQARAETALLQQQELTRTTTAAREDALARKRRTELSQSELREKCELEGENLPPSSDILQQIAELKLQAAITHDSIEKCPRSILDGLRQLLPGKLAEQRAKTQVSPEKAKQSLENIRACHAAVLAAVQLRDRLRFSAECTNCCANERLLSADGSHAIALEIEQAERVLDDAKRAYAADLLIRYDMEKDHLKKAQNTATKIARLQVLQSKSAEHAQATASAAVAERAVAELAKKIADLDVELTELARQLTDTKTNYRVVEDETKKIIGSRVALLQAVQKAYQNYEMAVGAETNRKTREDLQQEIHQKQAAAERLTRQLGESEKITADQTIARETLLRNISGCDVHVARLDERYVVEEKRSKAYAEALASKETLEAYRKILRANGGIADQLLARARPNLENAINASLRETGAQFSVSIDPNFEILHTSAQGALLPVTLASGYQKFALSFAARLALWRLASVPLPNCFMVDEGFATCDEGNQEAMGQLVEGLAAAPAAPRVVFVVSHLEALKARVARPLFIDLAPGGNRVHQALPGNADAPPPLAPAAPRAAAVAPAAPRAAAAKPAVVRLAPAKKKTSEEKPKRAVGRPRKAPAE